MVWRGIADWVNAQGWPLGKRGAALAIVERRCALNLNPMTAGEWRRWSEQYDES